MHLKGYNIVGSNFCLQVLIYMLLLRESLKS